MIVDGWLNTGDLLRCDEDGYLWYLGRKSNSLVIGKDFVLLIEIEEAPANHPLVSKSAAMVIPREDKSIPQIIAFVEPRLNQQEKNELCIPLENTLPASHQVLEVVSLSRLPLARSHPIDRHAL